MGFFPTPKHVSYKKAFGWEAPDICTFTKYT